MSERKCCKNAAQANAMQAMALNIHMHNISDIWTEASSSKQATERRSVAAMAMKSVKTTEMTMKSVKTTVMTMNSVKTTVMTMKSVKTAGPVQRVSVLTVMMTT